MTLSLRKIAMALFFKYLSRTRMVHYHYDYFRKRCKKHMFRWALVAVLSRFYGEHCTLLFKTFSTVAWRTGWGARCRSYCISRVTLQRQCKIRCAYSQLCWSYIRPHSFCLLAWPKFKAVPIYPRKQNQQVLVSSNAQGKVLAALQVKQTREPTISRYYGENANFPIIWQLSSEYCGFQPIYWQSNGRLVYHGYLIYLRIIRSSEYFRLLIDLC